MNTHCIQGTNRLVDQEIADVIYDEVEWYQIFRICVDSLFCCEIYHKHQPTFS